MKKRSYLRYFLKLGDRVFIAYGKRAVARKRLTDHWSSTPELSKLNAAPEFGRDRSSIYADSSKTIQTYPKAGGS